MKLVCFFVPTVLILYLNTVNAVMCVWILHTHCNNEFSANSFIMNAQIELSSIAMSKNDPKITKLDKYDIEANIEEIDNGENLSVFKYGFTALSNPKNVRLAIEGVARISGDSEERNEILEKDENNIPKILTMIYHELFPTFFLLSKNLNVSCPPHVIGSMGNQEFSNTDEIIQNTPDTITVEDSDSEQPEVVINSDVSDVENNDVIQPTV